MKLRLLHTLAQAQRTPAAARFALATRRPEEAQARFLGDLIRRNRDTEFGRRHGFSTAKDFARRVPLMTAEDLEPWVTRLMRGERRLLTEEAPIFYGRSTGSGGRHKHIPITPTYQAEFQRTVHAAFWHLYRRVPRGFTSRLLYFVGPRRVAGADDGNDIGSMSGYNFSALPPLVRTMYAWRPEVFTIADLDARAYVALHQAVVGDISLITGVFPLPIVAMLRDLERWRQPLADDLRRGTLDGAPALTAEERALFATRRPDLAERLAESPFPKLGLVYCWTTATAGLYVPELRRRLGPEVAVRDGIYAATEAWCNVCIGDEEPGGPAAVASVYLEFIPESGGEPVPVTGVRDGQRYSIVVTNSAGLYRYVLGDIVEICGFHHATPRLRFVRKTGAASNLAGELLDESHVNQAVGAALAALGLEATWFALVADPAGPGYDLLVEGAAHERLAELVDRELGAAAYSYGDLRGEGQLRPLRVVAVPAGRYDAWRRARIAEGAGEAQLKTAHLYDDPARVPALFREER